MKRTVTPHFLVSAIRLALPDGERAKRLARALGMSVQSGKRLAANGVIGRKRLPAVIAYLDKLIEKNEADLRAIRAELREIDAQAEIDSRRRAQGAAGAPLTASA